MVTYDFATAPFWISLYMRKFWFSFLSVYTRKRNLEGLVFLQVGDGVASQKLLCTTAQDGKSSLGFTEDIREYWMNYRGPRFLAVVWFNPPLSSVSSTMRRLTGRLRKRNNFLTGGGGEGEGAKSYDGEKAWSSLNHSILSG